MQSTLRLILAPLLIPAVVLVGETSSQAQHPPTAPPPAAPPPPPAQPIPSPPGYPTAPGYAAPPSYATPPRYTPPRYAPPPGYALPPGYASPPGYAPPPDYAPVYDYPPAYASQPPIYGEHSGLFARLTFGFGYLNASSPDYSFSGGALSLAGAFGGAIAPNLIIFGEVAWTGMPQPRVSVSGEPSYTEDELTLQMITIGPGIAYYFQPVNMYVSTSVGFGVFDYYWSEQYSPYDFHDKSDYGFGLSATAGKEWWLMRDLGLGLAVQFHMASAHHPRYGQVTGTGFAMLFSATYN